MNRQTIALVVVVAIASALIGALGVNELTGEARAAPGCPPKCPTPPPTPPPSPSPSPSATPSPTPAPLVARQAETTLMADENFNLQSGLPDDWHQTEGVAVIDASAYPVTANFKFAVGGVEGGSAAHCFRLVEIADIFATGPQTPVPGSEACTTANGQGYYFVIESPTFSLPAGRHLYAWQWKQGAGGAALLGVVRAIAQWTE